MTIAFFLNGAEVTSDVLPHRRSIHVLKDDFRCRSLKQQCRDCRCGGCMILLDGRPVPSCLLPAFDLRRRDLWTVEGLSARRNFEDIVSGFRESGIQPCSLCAASRALAAEALLMQTLKPNADELRDAADSVRCDCSSTQRVLDAMLRSARFRERRLRNG